MMSEQQLPGSDYAYVQADLGILWTSTVRGNKGPNQPAHMRRLIWAGIVRKLHKGPFRTLGIIYICTVVTAFSLFIV